MASIKGLLNTLFSCLALASLLIFISAVQDPMPAGRMKPKGGFSFQSKKPSVSIWTKTATERVLRSAWPEAGKKVELAAARNEWEFFQILMRSDHPVNGVTLEPCDLVGPGGSHIPAESAYLYRQHQFEITSPSWGVTVFTPGWYPDPLIPFKHPITHEPLTDPSSLLAVPFDLPANETHGFLVDLHVPPHTAPGLYEGTYILKEGSALLAKIPVFLTVWGFTLPEVPTLQTSFWAPEHQMRHLAWLKGETYPEAYWTEVADQCNELVSRHSIKPTLKAYSIYFETGDLEPDGSFDLGALYLGLIQQFIDAQKLNAIEIPFRGSPTIKEVVFGIAWYDENTFDPASFTQQQHDRLVAYLTSWDDAIDQLSNIEDILFHVYLCDEPNTKQAYDYVRTLGSAIRNAGLDHLKVLVVEQTTPDHAGWGDLYGAVDIWVPYFTSFDPTSAAARRMLGESIWTYTALTTWGGGLSWQTDLPLLNYRIPTWISWRHDIVGLLYWSMAYWWEDGFPDPWEVAQTYTNYYMGNYYYYNGDGVLVYPAEKVGYNGIAPGLRLKAVRDAIEDYEYLVILDSMGLHDEAMAIVAPLADSFTNFETDPAAYEQARIHLAELIVE
jgi:hypothetical protein